MADAIPTLVEEWRPVVGYDGLYDVSDLGRIRTVARRVPCGPAGGTREVPATIRKPFITEDGYAQVSLLRKSHKVHSLVAVAFIGPKPDGTEICHSDGDSLNNAVSNLRYDTPSQNSYDAVRHGTHWPARVTHCPQGHEYTLENITWNTGGSRKCRACDRARWHARKKRRPAA